MSAETPTPAEDAAYTEWAATTLATLLAHQSAFEPAHNWDESAEEPPEPDYCQHLSAYCACDRAADLYYGDI